MLVQITIGSATEPSKMILDFRPYRRKTEHDVNAWRPVSEYNFEKKMMAGSKTRLSENVETAINVHNPWGSLNNPGVDSGIP